MSKESVAVKMLLTVFVTAVALCVFSTWLSRYLDQIPTQDRRTETPRAVVHRPMPVTTEWHSETVEDRSKIAPGSAPSLIVPSPESIPIRVDAAEPLTLSVDVDERLAALRERESQLAARQEVMTLIHADICEEKAAIDEIRRRVDHELNNLFLKLRGPGSVTQQTAGGLQSQQPSVVREGQARTEDPNVIGAAYDGTNSENAAAIVQSLADNGRVDMVVKLLGVMNERLAAKVLTAVSDPNPDMAAQLTEMLQQQKLLQPLEGLRN